MMELPCAGEWICNDVWCCFLLTTFVLWNVLQRLCIRSSSLGFAMARPVSRIHLSEVFQPQQISLGMQRAFGRNVSDKINFEG